MKRIYFLSASLAASLTATVGLTQQVHAAGLEEVIVTAERRVQSAQDVPIAINAISQNQLDSQGASTLGGLSASIPAMQFSTQAADAPRVQVTIRGLGSDVIEVGSDTGVGLYLDNVYLGSTSALLSNVYDVSRVEVLRGPQGTLYGRNTTGGAINVISNKPVFETEGAADIAFGNYSSITSRAYLNSALTDTVAGRVSVVSERRDGFSENLLPNGVDADDRKSTYVKGQLLFNPNDDTSFLLGAFSNQITGAGPATRIIGEAPQIVIGGVLPNGVPNLTGVSTPSAFAGAKPLPTDWHKVRRDVRNSADILLRGLTGNLKMNFDDLAFNSITSYQTNRLSQFVDADSTELDIQTRQRDEEGEQFTQEFTLASGNDSLDWLVGAFYLKDETDVRFELDIAPGFVGFGGPGGGANQTVVGDVTSKSKAIFGQTSYRPSEAIELVAGLRYTEDEKSINTSAGFLDTTNRTLLLGGGAKGRVTKSKSKTFDAVTGKIGLNWFPAEDVMVYGSYSRGFKSGGFNLGNPKAGDAFTFEPEEIDAFEVGMKSRFLSDALQLNLSAFKYDVESLQLQLFGVGGPTIFNATDAEVKGLEIDLTAQPTDALNVTASLALLDATFNEGFAAVDPTRPSFLQDAPVVDLSGNSLPRSPEVSAGITVNYTTELESGASLAFDVNYSYRDKTFFNAFNPTDNFRFQPSYDLIGGAVTYTSKDDNWNVSVFGQNLTDEQYITNVFIPPIIIGAPTEASIGAPRTVGVRFGMNF